MAVGSKQKRGKRRRTEPAAPAARAGAASFALLFAAFAGAALIVLAPALRGPFVSDDLHYVPNNPYVTGFSLALVDDVFDPRGEAVTITENYTPVHLLFHAAAWRATARCRSRPSRSRTPACWCSARRARGSPMPAATRSR